MIAGVEFRRFKRFSSLELELAPLTVLTGLNSAGKTTTIQGLLLLRSALLGNGQVSLHGAEGLGLGEPSDVLHHGSGDETIELRARAAGTDTWATARLGVPTDARALYLNRLGSAAPEACPAALVAQEPIFTYLCAERHGPRDTLAAEAHGVDHLGVGVYGQRTAQVLSLLDRREVAQARLAPTARDDDRIAALSILRRQTERWLARILGLEGIMDIDARWIEGTTVTSLRFKMPGSHEWTRPQNVGFGVSYVLPIVVAALQAPKGGLLIVENPEAHLHPAGQSAVGAFLARVAADGVQVVVETHSDHVINGIRRAVAEKSAAPTADEVAVLFFRPDAGGVAGATHQRIALRETGELSAWPTGFFDQIEHDLGAIARARRGSRQR